MTRLTNLGGSFWLCLFLKEINIMQTLCSEKNKHYVIYKQKRHNSSSLNIAIKHSIICFFNSFRHFFCVYQVKFLDISLNPPWSLAASRTLSGAIMREDEKQTKEQVSSPERCYTALPHVLNSDRHT